MIKIITLFASGLLGLEDEKPDCFAQQNSKKKLGQSFQIEKLLDKFYV